MTLEEAIEDRERIAAEVDELLTLYDQAHRRVRQIEKAQRVPLKARIAKRMPRIPRIRIVVD